MTLIPAYQKDTTFLADVESAKAHPDAFHLWWLGQSGYLLQWNNRHLLIDPYLSDSLTEKYAATDKPHIRMSERVIAPERLPPIDIVTSSHNHTDHLDAATLQPVLAVNPAVTFIIPEANRAFVADRVTCDPDFPLGLTDDQSVTVADFTITGIPAAHNELERDDHGRCKFMGYVFQFGPWTIYHSGDTLWHEDILAALRPFDLDLVILPINGHRLERRVAGNLNAAEAVRMAQVLQAKLLIPCHYDMFTFNTADPEEFVRLAQEQGQFYRVLRGGERCSIA